MMSRELRKIQRLVRECTLANSEVLEPDHSTVVYNQIIAAFKAHIKEWEEPKNPHRRHHKSLLRIGFDQGIEEYRKALMESLK